MQTNYEDIDIPISQINRDHYSIKTEIGNPGNNPLSGHMDFLDPGINIHNDQRT